MTNLETKIARIGQQIMACNIKCRGIRHNQSAGVLPRFLILESARHPLVKGCAAIGINPGQAKPRETEYYRRHGAEYETVVRYWLDKITRHAYYVKIRSFIDQVGLAGPILWSELAKCERQPGTKGPPPLKTLRTCTGCFLTRELKLIPRKWPLIGIGWEAYKALAYLYPNRTVIGLPHPTGSRGQFYALFENSMLKSKVASQARLALKSTVPTVIWLAAGV